jgi:hypothetical protein
MLHSSTLTVKLWAEASATAVYLLNRVPCKAVPTRRPYQAWHGRKPNVSHLHVFGCDAYALIPKDERTKLDPKDLNVNSFGTQRHKELSDYGIHHLEKLKSQEMSYSMKVLKQRHYFR